MPFNSGPVATAFANRLKGAMVYAVFGSFWMVLWNQRAFAGNNMINAVVAAAGLLILMLAMNRYRSFKPALEEENAAQKQSRMRRFYIVNAVQWGALLVIINVLNNIGLAAWVTPAAIMVIGLHFFPLATIFQNPGHTLMGTVICLFACVFPFVLSGGPADPYACAGMALILWTGAIRNISKTFHAAQTVSQ
ncbi:hypothetical protein H8L32_05940 [Undibacterium sp. CY18W]|uniref:Uncharacterized protein n=1 Tax=Undibacterium hunanense TaxID=2762292 RepID=A0ABR6ZM89_9BURK|nr:hypothetical protein [Undibacterium hunanense]MBC3917011.1 hypothetical protein [Undibacterium hunanense]